MPTKPWDARLAEKILKLLVHSSTIHPNHFTAVRLITGLVGAWLFTGGNCDTLAALFFIFSNFLDHFDGEFARLKNQSSKFGHYFDLISDLIVTSGTFLCIGIGISNSTDSEWAIAMGIVSGFSNVVIFQIRHIIESKHGKKEAAQPSVLGFEAEDILYLLPLVTLCNQLETFLMLASLGAPVAAIIVLVQFIKYYKL